MLAKPTRSEITKYNTYAIHRLQTDDHFFQKCVFNALAIDTPQTHISVSVL